MIKLKNKKTHIQKSGEIDIYIGRGSPLGNPFKIGKEWSRNRVCEEYEKYFYRNVCIKDSPVRNEVIRIFKLVRSGRNVNLICFCSPSRCHGETVIKFLSAHLPIETLTDDESNNLSLF